MKLNFLKTIDWTLVALPALLAIAGVMTIYSTTLGTASAYIAWRQIIYAAVGLACMFGLTLFNYRSLKGLAWIFYIIGIILLTIVLFLGKKVFGATRWIDLGIFQLQPSEVMKLAIVILAAAFLSSGTTLWVKKIIWLAALFIIPIAMVLRQPDLGTAIVILAIFIGMFLIWPIPKKVKWIALFVFIVLLPMSWLLLKDYQRERVYTFVNIERDPYGTGYNVIQSVIAIGSGGIWGRGLGNGPQSQLNFLPVSHSDFIFAGWSEATGLAGSIALILTLLILNWRIYNVAVTSKDEFAKYLAIGVGIIFTVQIAINIGMNMGMAPVTGIPLPFVSYGGTAMLMNFVALGILQSIYVRNKK